MNELRKLANEKYSWLDWNKSHLFAAYNSTTSVKWLSFVGQWGDEQYQRSCHGRYGVFGQYRYSSGPTGLESKDLNRGDGTCLSGLLDPCVILPVITSGERRNGYSLCYLVLEPGPSTI